MNNFDLEKTQVWAKNLIDAPVAAQASGPLLGSVTPVKPLLPIQKPVLKPLTKEEKIVLAAGGALAIGLGAIVISSFSDDSDVIETDVNLSRNLNAPQLNFGTPEISNEQVLPKVQELPHSSPGYEQKSDKHVRPAVSVPKPELNHALQEIPDVPQVACVGDDTTFIEAFNAARKEVGPAGLFAWRDTFYSTFTDKEWQSVPDKDKEKWLRGAEPIIDPEPAVEEIVVPVDDAQHNVIVVERGPITWTGIDKDGDGSAEILMARIHGQPPLVLMDTNGDGILDTRYDYDSSTGKTFASVIDPLVMSIQDIEKMDYFPAESDLGFFTQNSNHQSSERLPVMIHQENDVFLISLDSNLDNTIDVVTYLSDERGPVVGLDFDNDGKIEMGYVYDSDTQTINFSETDPLQEMNFGPPESPAITIYEAEDTFFNFESAALSVEMDDDTEAYFTEDSDENNDEPFS